MERSDIGTSDGLGDLFQYIQGRTYNCSFCRELQRRVIASGLEEIKRWDGMICACIEDMQIRLTEVETGKKCEPLEFRDELFA